MEEVYELLEYLPIDDQEVNDYIRPLYNSARVNFEGEVYQFSYFSVHLIFMTDIYVTVWKIGIFHKDRYENSLLFARPYNGCKVDFKDIKSIFDFSFLPEKDIFEFFTLIDVDNGYIKSIKNLINDRNNIAHATGKFQISSVDNFNEALKIFVSVLDNLQSKLDQTIKEWYKSELIQYAKNSLPIGYSTITDYINDVFINSLSFSKKDFEACNNFGLSKLKNRNLNKFTKKEVGKIEEFHKALIERYTEIMEF